MDFGSFDILSDEEVRAGLKVYSNWPTFPQVCMYSTAGIWSSFSTAMMTFFVFGLRIFFIVWGQSLL